MKCRKNTESKNPKVKKTKNRRIMFVSKYEASDSNKSKFIREQEASRLLGSSVINRLLSKIPLVGLLCFRGVNKLIQWNNKQVFISRR